MPIFYGVRELGQPEDWRPVVGRDKWVPGRSAFELAHKWQGCDGFPSRVKAVLSAAGEPFVDLSSMYGMVEMPTFLDTLKAPSRTDVMLYCKTRNDQPVIIGVEGKATEPFGDPVNAWVRRGGAEPTPSRRRRLRFLSNLLGVQITDNAAFGYQLVHRTASVVSECILHRAQVGVVLVHSFSEANAQNWVDFRAFTKLVGVSIRDTDKDVLKGVARLGPKQEVGVHFAWVRDQPIQGNAEPGAAPDRSDINNAEDIQRLELCELRRLSNEAIRQLSEDLQDIFRAEQLHALRRSDANNAAALVEEFKAPFRGHMPELHYELAFVPAWCETTKDVYQARWWINEYRAGVYFIYDSDDKLQYIGSCCGGALGKQIYEKTHECYRHAVDIVLFDRQWCHFALAFEALAISRLQPLKNKHFTKLWVQPVSPFDRIWPQP